MITVPSSTYLTLMQAKTTTPSVRFFYDSVSYDKYVLSISEISRDANLSAGIATIELSNTDQSWNIFYSDSANLAKKVELKLGLGGEDMTIYTGTVESARYEDASVFLNCRDKIATMLELPIGSSDTSVDYFAYAWNPADLVSDILQNHAGFSGSDLDTTALNAWQSDCASKNYALKAKFTGQSVRTAISKIAQLTASYISINNLGQVDFAPPHTTADSFTDDNCNWINLDVSKDELCNEYNVKYGYDPDDDSWTGTEQETADSQSDFGVKDFLENNRFVWHDTLASAEGASAQVIARYGWPIKYIDLQTTLYGLRTEIADKIVVTETLKGISSVNVIVTEIGFIDLNRGTVDLRGHISA